MYFLTHFLFLATLQCQVLLKLRLRRFCTPNRTLPNTREEHRVPLEYRASNSRVHFCSHCPACRPYTILRPNNKAISDILFADSEPSLADREKVNKNRLVVKNKLARHVNKSAYSKKIECISLFTCDPCELQTGVGSTFNAHLISEDYFYISLKITYVSFATSVNYKKFRTTLRDT